MVNKQTIRKKDRDTIIQALKVGVVPRCGLPLIQVGRKAEVEALIVDIDNISEGSSSIRFIIGEYGAGKTFFLNLVRSIALEKGLVTLSADLNPSRRLYSSSGQSRSLYMELVKNMATRTKPEGGALAGIVEKFITLAEKEATLKGCTVDERIQQKLISITELVGGFDFAQVITCYYHGFIEGNEELKGNAIKWLRGEFSAKTDSKATLGVRTLIEDSNYYDYLKLMAKFVKLAGYAGLFICIDEMVNIYKLTNTVSRNSNYEQILRIVNDCLQSNTEGIGFIFGGTPEFYLDTRRGMFSYEALRGRLAQNTFASELYKDLSGPVIQLSSLTPEDLYVLLCNINNVYSFGNEDLRIIPESVIANFMEHSSKQLGNDYFRTPRTTIKAFVDFLAILDQHKELKWEELLTSITIEKDNEDGQYSEEISDDGEILSNFRL